MSSTYSSNLRIELIGSGDQAGAWGATTDSNLAYILDTAVAGYQVVPITSTNQALTYVNGPSSSAALNQSVYAMLKFTGASAATSVYIPPASKQYIVYNNSGYTITIYNSTVIGNTTAAGTGISVVNGDKIMVWSDATNVFDLQAQNLTGTLAIAKGGTGQTTANAAFNALAPAQTANRLLKSDGTNTSFAQAVLTTDVTGTLPIANGGTGSTSTTFVSLTTNVTGTLPTANGGTGAATFTSGALLKGAGSGAVTTASAADIVGQIGSTAVTNATTATTATTANALNASNSYSAVALTATNTAKVWVAHDGGGSIQSSYNVSSVSRTGSGKYTVNFSTTQADASYCCTIGIVGSNNGDETINITGRSTTNLTSSTQHGTASGDYTSFIAIFR